MTKKESEKDMEMDVKKLRVSVVGATGYTGVETVRLLLQHPRVHLHRLYAHSHAGKTLSQVYPALAGLLVYPTEISSQFREAPHPNPLPKGEREIIKNSRLLSMDSLPLLPLNALSEEDSNVLFFCLPPGASSRWILPLLQSKTFHGKIIDLGADFRLKDPQEYARYYQETHPSPELLSRFTYGLSEFYQDEIQRSDRVANPGCFATALQLALLPLCAPPVADTFFIQAMTGSSGSGAQPSPTTHFPTRFGNVKAYQVFQHRHLGEVRQALQSQINSLPHLVFIPVSGPFVRGIWATLSFTLGREVDVAGLFQKMYRREKTPFIRLIPGALPELKSVVGSNFADIGWMQNGEQVVVGVALDNMIKGAAGQAIQNMNLMSGFPETEGLWTPPFTL